MFVARAIWVQMQKQTTFAHPIHTQGRKDTQTQFKSFSQSHSDMEPMEPVFFHLTFAFVFALPRFTCVNKSAMEVQEYFFSISFTGTCTCICIFMVYMCIPCVCIYVISVNHAWGSCLWKWRNDCRSERNLCNCVKKPEKNSGLQRDLNPWHRDAGAML